MSAAEPEEPQSGRRRRLTAFRWGVIVGAVSPIAVWLGGHAFFHSLGADKPRFNVQIVSVGEDVSRAGGAQVVIGPEHGRLAQTCSGTCDDLWVNLSTGDDSVLVSVLDGSGKRLAYGGPGYVTTSDYGAGTARTTIAGRAPLTITDSFVRWSADGSMAESYRTVDWPRATSGAAN